MCCLPRWYTHLAVQVEQYFMKLERSPFVCMDGNIPLETIKYVCNLCRDAGVPGIVYVKWKYSIRHILGMCGELACKYMYMLP